MVAATERRGAVNGDGPRGLCTSGRSTPAAAGRTEGLTFLDEAPRIAAESERLRRRGVKVQVVDIHQGTNVGANPQGNAPRVEWQGPSSTSPTRSRRRRSTRWSSGDDLLQVTIDYIAANSPVDPVVEGRIVGP
jgi:hypothetical protein